MLVSHLSDSPRVTRGGFSWVVIPLPRSLERGTSASFKCYHFSDQRHPHRS